MLPGDRILIAEFHGQMVSERNLKGEILWQRQANMPISAQRLANGNTFIVTRNQLVEVDNAGARKCPPTTVRLTISWRPAGCTTAGSFAPFLPARSLLWLDATGKEVKTVPVGPMHLNGIDALPNGRVLVAQINNNRVVEVDGEGKTVWEATVQQPTSAVRLANGNTLVACQNMHQVVELNHSGKVVWEYKTTNGGPSRRQQRR